MTSLLAAAEEGNVDAINELMESSSHFDINLCNRVRLNALVIYLFLLGCLLSVYCLSVLQSERLY